MRSKPERYQTSVKIQRIFTIGCGFKLTLAALRLILNLYNIRKSLMNFYGCQRSSAVSPSATTSQDVGLRFDF